MTLKNRIEKLENIANPEEIKISTNLWNEDKEPWPATPEEKRAYEATRPGVKTIWVEASKSSQGF